MLKKLIKYDLKWSLKIISVYYIIGFILAVVGRLFNFFPDTTFFVVIGGIVKGASISLTITGIVNCIIRSWVRMMQNMYKDESYLTHTIPTARNNHYLSKVISTLITLTISFAVLVINLLIMYLSKNTIEVVRSLFSMLENFSEGSGVLILILVFVLLFVEFLFIILCGFFGIIYGHSFDSGKLAKSFMFGFITYGVVNTVSLVVMIITALFSQDIFDVMFNQAQTINMNTFIILMIISLSLYVIYSVVLFVLSSKKLSKGINIE